MMASAYEAAARKLELRVRLIKLNSSASAMAFYSPHFDCRCWALMSVL
jgi:hypothetical protein